MKKSLGRIAIKKWWLEIDLTATVSLYLHVLCILMLYFQIFARIDKKAGKPELPKGLEKVFLINLDEHRYLCKWHVWWRVSKLYWAYEFEASFKSPEIIWLWIKMNETNFLSCVGLKYFGFSFFERPDWSWRRGLFNLKVFQQGPHFRVLFLGGKKCLEVQHTVHILRYSF